MNSNLPLIFPYVFADEGGFVVRATEPGGAGNLGVSFNVFKSWWTAKGKPGIPTFDDLHALSKDDAADIYTSLYAVPLHFNDLPSGVDYCVLDSGINDGPHASINLLERALRLSGDGKFTLALLAAAKATDPHQLINDHCDLCLARKRTNPEWAQWGPGWTRRVEKRRARSLSMIEVSL